MSQFTPEVYTFTLVSTKGKDIEYFLRNGPFPSFDGVMYAVALGNSEECTMW